MLWSPLCRDCTCYGFAALLCYNVIVNDWFVMYLSKIIHVAALHCLLRMYISAWCCLVWLVVHVCGLPILARQGIVPTVAKSVVSTAVTFYVYEVSKWHVCSIVAGHQ